MAEPTALRCSRSADGALVIRLAGSWTLEDALPAPDAVEREVASAPPIRRVTFDSAGLADWDRIAFLAKCAERAAPREFPVRVEGRRVLAQW